MNNLDKVIHIYQRFYAQRGVLNGAPTLSINADAVGTAEFPTEKAVAEMDAVAAYLMGLAGLKNIPFERQVKIVKESYQGQPFWQELLYDYLELKLDLEDERLEKQAEEVSDKILMTQYLIAEHEDHEEEIINHYAAKVAKEKFHVDAVALIRNYMKMIRKDPKKAWEVLITNPAYFSPIKTEDEKGKKVLSPAQAISENARLAHFLKGLKG